MYKIKLTARAKKELKALSKTHQLAIAQIFNDHKEDPKIGKPLTRELSKRFSYKVGVYRIIFKVIEKDKIVYVLTAGCRTGIYN